MVMRRLGLGLGGVIGAAVAVQGRINGELGVRLEDGVTAAVVSFGSGFLLLVVAMLFSARLRAGLGEVRAALATGKLRPWQLLGGLCGATFVASQGLTVAALGVTVFTVVVVTGQLVSSLVVDRLGVGPNGRTPVTGFRIGGAVLAVAAVAVAGSAGAGSGPSSTLPAFENAPTGLLLLLPAVAGIGMAWQQGVNARVGAVGGSLSATVVNFGVGLLGLIALDLALLTVRGWPERFPSEPWLYLGGAIGVVFIAAGVLVVRWVGVLLMGLSSVAGQLTCSVLLDWLLPTGADLSPVKLLGCALTLIAVTIAARPTRAAQPVS